MIEIILCILVGSIALLVIVVSIALLCMIFEDWKK